MRISEAARQSGLSVGTVRYYETIGLIAAPDREPSSGYRSYSDTNLRRLQFIADARQLGLTLDEIRDILAASDADHVSCPHLVNLLETKRNRIALWIEHARQLHDALDRTIQASREIVEQSSPVNCCPVIERGLHERAFQIATDAGAPAPLAWGDLAAWDGASRNTST
jgi:MerR family transcriptional regulator, copper efflux regulator